jgi:hypothetical protein
MSKKKKKEEEAEEEYKLYNQNIQVYMNKKGQKVIVRQYGVPNNKPPYGP